MFTDHDTFEEFFDNDIWELGLVPKDSVRRFELGDFGYGDLKNL